MMPILLHLGPVTIYSFGALLSLMLVLVSFFVWRQARKIGLSEEKVLDALLLSVIVALIVGRLSFVYMNWSVFSVDLSKAVLVLKYPGLDFVAVAIAGVLSLVLFSFSLGLDWLLVADIFSLAILPMLSLGYFGCFLDGCYQNSQLLLALTAMSLVLGLVLHVLAYRLTSSSDLLEFSRRRGLFFLAYLIFLFVSFLMLRDVASDRILTVVYFVILGVLLAVLGVRYHKLFLYVIKKTYGAISQRRFDTG